MDQLKQYLAASNQKAALVIAIVNLASLILLTSLLGLGHLGWLHLSVSNLVTGLKLVSLTLPVALVWMSSAGWSRQPDRALPFSDRGASRRRRSIAAAPPLPWPGHPRYFTQACKGCQHYHGRYYGDRPRTFLVCAMHPYGWPEAQCPDWLEF